MLKRLFGKKKPSGNFIDIDEDIISTDFECSLESLSFSSQCEDVFLNRFTQSQVLEHLKNSGLLPGLEKLGFNKVVADITKDDTGIHHLKLYTTKAKKNLGLIDIRISFKNPIGKGISNPLKIDFTKFNMAVLEWISLENPGKKFTKDKHPMPGQVHPGLGLLGQAMNFLSLIATAGTIDGYIIIPDHFHAAAMYSRYGFFIDPCRQAELTAVLASLKSLTLEEISWGFTTRTITDIATGQEASYKPSPLVFPVSGSLKKVFLSKKYTRMASAKGKHQSYALNSQEMLAAKSRILKTGSVSQV